jgi:hypothetical protein
MGAVFIGAAATGVTLGNATTTVTVLGALAANSASVAGPVTASALGVSGVLTAAGATLSGPLTATGSLRLGGSLLLGGDGAYTLGRPALSAGVVGNATVLVGQAASGVGGSLAIDAGAGGLAAGAVLIGAVSDSITLGAVGRNVTVAGDLFTAQISSVGPVTAASVVAVGAMSAASLSLSGAVSAAGISTSGTLTVAGSASVAGSLLLGTSAGAYTIGRPGATLNTAGLDTVLLGQAAGGGSVVGGTLVLDGGTGGASAGTVRLGAASGAVVLGAFNRTVTAPGTLLVDTVSVTAGVAAATVSVSGGLTAASLSTGGVASAAGISTSGALTVAGSTALRGSVQVGTGTEFTLGRAARGAVAAGTTTYVQGQAGGGAACAGGNLVLDAGTGGTAGLVYVGRSSEGVVIGQVGKTTVFLGPVSISSVSNNNVQAASMSVTGTLTTGAATVLGSLTANGISTGAPLTVIGSSVLAGSLLVGNDNAFTMARPVRAVSANGLATVLLGQNSGHPACVGGDLVMDAGAGFSAGTVYIGTASQALVLGATGKTVSTLGAVVVSGALSATSAMTAASFSSAGVATAAAFSTAGPVTAASLSLAGPVSAAALSTAGALSGLGMTLTGSLTVGGTAVVTGSVRLGGDTTYTVGRLGRVLPFSGNPTVLIGQAAGDASSLGGDLIIEVYGGIPESNACR